MIKFKCNIKAAFLLVFVLLGTMQLFAQIRVDFAPRTSTKAPAPYTSVQNYNLQGDFTMIGNTNLTLVNYHETGSSSHNGNSMRYVDIDNVTSTVNSSSAQLVIPDADCSEIIYAGLYWTGRAHNTANSDHTFTVTKSLGHNYQENNITLTVSREGTGNNSYYPRYTLTNGSGTVQIDFTNNSGNNRVQYRQSTSGSFTNIPVSYSSSSNTGTATFNTALTLTIGGQQITITGLQRESRTNQTEDQYLSTSRLLLNSKELDKHKVQLRKDNLSYQEITATEIYFPSGNSDNLYSGYADVTDYVRANGVGNYFVADIATQEGVGGSIGYSAGWGMVIIYKNPAMKWRDITVFDGFGFMNSSSGATELPISGFRAAQNGNVNIKLGMMAGEGDYHYSGDYFNIQNAAGNWRRIDKDGSTVATTSNGTSLPSGSSGNTNFFDSSVLIGGAPRNPNLVNNTGVDFVMFDLDNPWDATNNRYSIIPNNATSARFQFGTNQDVYSIFNIVFAVDAYVPEIVGENTPANAGTVHGSTVIPGQDLEFDLKIYNKGEEAVNNMKVEIPIPFNLHYDPTAIIEIGTGAVKIPANTTVSWVPPTGAPSGATPQNTPGGKLVWDIGTLPYDASKSILQGTLKYRLKVTQNCALLTTAGSCGLQVKINGKITGTGATSATVVSSDLVRDYGAGVCAGPVYDNFESTINVGEAFIQACGLPVENNHLQFKAFCSLPGDAFPRADIANIYPATTKFFSSVPTSYESTTNVITGDFPVSMTGAKTTYYAMIQGMDPGCYIILEISVEVVTTTPTANSVSFCFGDTVTLNVTRSATGVANDYELFYYDTSSATTPMTTTPNPTTIGTHTYWVAEGVSQNGVICTGPKASFTITINEVPVVQQDVNNVSICENNDTQFSVTTSGATSYIWEYTTATAPTVWNTLTNSTFNGQISINDNTLIISHAVRVGTQVINGIKVRLKAVNDNDCEEVSNEVSIEVKDCRAITNPMLPSKANK